MLSTGVTLELRLSFDGGTTKWWRSKKERNNLLKFDSLHQNNPRAEVQGFFVVK